MHQQYGAARLSFGSELVGAVVGRLQRELGDDAVRVVAAERKRVGLRSRVHPLPQLGEQSRFLLQVRFERFESRLVPVTGFLVQQDSVPRMQLR